MKHGLLLVLLMFVATPAVAKLNVFTCEPEWQALVKEIASDRVEVFSATTGLQDPHHIQARPSLIARMRRADLVVCTGAGLESAWLPLLQRRAGNQLVQPGGIGYLEAAATVSLLDIPATVDRSMGDIHGQGNPHFHTDPRNIPRVADELVRRLVLLDAANGEEYQQRGKRFNEKWLVAIKGWERKASSLRGMPVAVQHNNWRYLSAWLGLSEVATLEAKPGVPPTVNHLTSVMEVTRQQHARMIIRGAYEDARPSEWLSEKTGLAIVTLPYTVGGNEQATDLYSLFEDSIQRLLMAAGGK